MREPLHPFLIRLTHKHTRGLLANQARIRSAANQAEHNSGPLSADLPVQAVTIGHTNSSLTRRIPPTTDIVNINMLICMFLSGIISLV